MRCGKCNSLLEEMETIEEDGLVITTYKCSNYKCGEVYNCTSQSGDMIEEYLSEGYWD